MDLDVARNVAGAGQVAGVVSPLRLEPGGDVGDVAELPDLDGGADGQAVGRGAQGHAHRRLEGAEVGVHRPVLLADDDELAGLVGRDQQRDAELIEEGGEVDGMDAAERRRRAVSAAAGGPVVSSLRSAGWADASATRDTRLGERATSPTSCCRTC